MTNLIESDAGFELALELTIKAHLMGMRIAEVPTIRELFPTNTFIQTQFGADLPRHTDIAPQSIFCNAAIGQSFGANHGLGRLWSPMFEFVGARDLVDKAKTNWDVLPQMQVTISKRQHIRANLGVRIPVNNTAGRQVQVMFYLLWDWFDGRLNEGW